MAKYGIPYQGSKNKIANRIIDCLPSAEYFVDLFAGGCAMTHAAMESGKYKHFILNDIGSAPQIFIDAINGEYADWTLQPTREQFYALKDVDEAVALMFSFGNTKDNYLYGKNIEKVKSICSNMLCASSKKERYVWFKAFVKLLIENKQTADELTRADDRPLELQRLQSLESLERLRSQKENITVSRLSYDEVKIPKNSVVYCDPPYRQTVQNGYDGNTFNYEAFDAWLASVDFPVFVSEYTQPANTKEIASFDTHNTFSATKTKKVQEKLFIQERFYDQYQKELNPTPTLNLYESKEA